MASWRKQGSEHPIGDEGGTDGGIGASQTRAHGSILLLRVRAKLPELRQRAPQLESAECPLTSKPEEAEVFAKDRSSTQPCP